jgi:flagellar basal-body rod protein FlgC
MSGMRAASARLEVSADNLVNQQTRGAVPANEAGPALKPASTPVPKVYRPMRANLYSLTTQQGGGVGVQYQQVTPGYFEVHDPAAPQANGKGMVAAPAVDTGAELIEQIQAAVHYRTSLKALQAAQDMSDAALDILT